jgi:hypothetical protein
VYEPHLVAEAILFAAEHPRRDITIGGMGKLIDITERISPRLMDKFLLATGWMQKSKQPDDRIDAVDNPSGGTADVRGEWGKRSNKVSPITKMDYYPTFNRAVIVAMLSSVGIFLLSRRRA